MDWKRIMNRSKEGRPELQNESELERENDMQKEIVQEYLNGLLPELNLRLFLELTDDEAIYINAGEISSVIKYPQMMLWAESITVTSYDYTVDTSQKKERIINRLMGTRTKNNSFTLKKYKKERR